MKDEVRKELMIANMHCCCIALVMKICWTYHDCFRLEELRNWRFHSTVSVMQTGQQYFVCLLPYSSAVTEGCYVPFSLN
jgi:hypothetical protein